MRMIVMIFIILNNFVWFLAFIGSLNSYAKGVTPPPAPPSLFLVVLCFVLLVMNALILLYVSKQPKMEVQPQPQKGVDMKRFFIGLGWFVVIYVVGAFMIGAVVGAIAGSSTSTPAEGAEAGRTASLNFFHKYGTLFFLSSVLAAIVGTVTGWLPFTKDEKN